MVKSRRSASACQSRPKRTTARRPSVARVDVLAQRRHLDDAMAADHRHRAMLDAGRRRVQLRPRRPARSPHPAAASWRRRCRHRRRCPSASCAPAPPMTRASPPSAERMRSTSATSAVGEEGGVGKRGRRIGDPAGLLEGSGTRRPVFHVGGHIDPPRLAARERDQDGDRDQHGQRAGGAEAQPRDPRPGLAARCRPVPDEPPDGSRPRRESGSRERRSPGSAACQANTRS